MQVFLVVPESLLYFEPVNGFCPEDVALFQRKEKPSVFFTLAVRLWGSKGENSKALDLRSGPLWNVSEYQSTSLLNCNFFYSSRPKGLLSWL